MGLHIEFWVGRGLVGVGDSSEVGDDTSPGLLVESLDVSLLADLEGGGDVALVEGEVGLLVDFPGEVSVLLVGGDEGHEHQLAGHGKELGNL